MVNLHRSSLSATRNGYQINPLVWSQYPQLRRLARSTAIPEPQPSLQVALGVQIPRKGGICALVLETRREEKETMSILLRAGIKVKGLYICRIVCDHHSFPMQLRVEVVPTVGHHAFYFAAASIGFTDHSYWSVVHSLPVTYKKRSVFG